MPDPREKLIVALDVPGAGAAKSVLNQLGEATSFYKVGLELFTAAGPQLVRYLALAGNQVFLDLKFHDIPNTAASAARAAAGLGVRMITVHASGGGAMLRAASEAAKSVNADVTVLAVTVLTSLREAELIQVGIGGSVADEVMRLAELAVQNGCDGLVCSAQEAGKLRAEFGPGLVIVTPGIRPAGTAVADQARTATPADAMRAGASHIVVGRPITAAPDPIAAAKAILEELSAAL